MKSKKFVLAGLVLAAITMVLLPLSGCKDAAGNGGGVKVYSSPEEVKVLTADEYSSPNNTGSEWTYVAFGEWPQSEASGITPTLVDPQPENLFKDKYYFDANGEYVKEGGKYYKVEPIVWRVLNKDYKTTGTALLLAEKILTGGVPYYDVCDTDRTVGVATIHPNNYEHSAVRAWLNGLKYQYKGPDGGGQIEKEDYFGKGFLQTAFTESARELIADTTVDNTAASTTDAGSTLPQATNYVCSDTTDKIFLLSEKEATTSEYGFAAYSKFGEGSTRIRVTTDYAKATGAFQEDSLAGYGGWWWLVRNLIFPTLTLRIISSRVRQSFLFRMTLVKMKSSVMSKSSHRLNLVVV